MNLAWVVPAAGAPAMRNLHAADRARLLRAGFTRFELEWRATDGRARTAPVYAERTPTIAEIVEGASVIFGSRGAGAVRLLDETGAPVLT